MLSRLLRCGARMQFRFNRFVCRVRPVAHSARGFCDRGTDGGLQPDEYFIEDFTPGKDTVEVDWKAESEQTQETESEHEEQQSSQTKNIPSQEQFSSTIVGLCSHPKFNPEAMPRVIQMFRQMQHFYPDAGVTVWDDALTKLLQRGMFKRVELLMSALRESKVNVSHLSAEVGVSNMVGWWLAQGDVSRAFAELQNLRNITDSTSHPVPAHTLSNLLYSVSATQDVSWMKDSDNDDEKEVSEPTEPALVDALAQTVLFSLVERHIEESQTAQNASKKPKKVRWSHELPLLYRAVCEGLLSRIQRHPLLAHWSNSDLRGLKTVLSEQADDVDMSIALTAIGDTSGHPNFRLFGAAVSWLDHFHKPSGLIFDDLCTLARKQRRHDTVDSTLGSDVKPEDFNAQALAEKRAREEALDLVAAGYAWVDLVSTDYNNLVQSSVRWGDLEHSWGTIRAFESNAVLHNREKSSEDTSEPQSFMDQIMIEADTSWVDCPVYREHVCGHSLATDVVGEEGTLPALDLVDHWLVERLPRSQNDATLLFQYRTRDPQWDISDPSTRDFDEHPHAERMRRRQAQLVQEVESKLHKTTPPSITALLPHPKCSPDVLPNYESMLWAYLRMFRRGPGWKERVLSQIAGETWDLPEDSIPQVDFKSLLYRDPPLNHTLPLHSMHPAARNAVTPYFYLSHLFATTSPAQFLSAPIAKLDDEFVAGKKHSNEVDRDHVSPWISYDDDENVDTDGENGQQNLLYEAAGQTPPLNRYLHTLYRYCELRKRERDRETEREKRSEDKNEPQSVRGQSAKRKAMYKKSPPHEFRECVLMPLRAGFPEIAGHSLSIIDHFGFLSSYDVANLQESVEIGERLIKDAREKAERGDRIGRNPGIQPMSGR